MVECTEIEYLVRNMYCFSTAQISIN